MKTVMKLASNRMGDYIRKQMRDANREVKRAEIVEELVRCEFCNKEQAASKMTITRSDQVACSRCAHHILLEEEQALQEEREIGAGLMTYEYSEPVYDDPSYKPCNCPDYPCCGH